MSLIQGVLEGSKLEEDDQADNLASKSSVHQGSSSGGGGSGR
jgi:hypothetical protein